uniref:Uncharacterized protein n=1 Tax=Anopheles maculatus TaxID=74869 RepID=A0A182T0H0_9DIPT
MSHYADSRTYRRGVAVYASVIRKQAKVKTFANFRQQYQLSELAMLNANARVCLIANRCSPANWGNSCYRIVACNYIRYHPASLYNLAVIPLSDGRMEIVCRSGATPCPSSASGRNLECTRSLGLTLVVVCVATIFHSRLVASTFDRWFFGGASVRGTAIAGPIVCCVPVGAVGVRCWLGHCTVSIAQMQMTISLNFLHDGVAQVCLSQKKTSQNANTE